LDEVQTNWIQFRMGIFPNKFGSHWLTSVREEDSLMIFCFNMP
jgi:hypothetical protein